MISFAYYYYYHCYIHSQKSHRSDHLARSYSCPPCRCINHDERNHVIINEKSEGETQLTSSRNPSNNAENFLPDQMGMGKLGRYLRRLSSPRIRFLRKSRQSKPDPTRLFHNLLVAKLGGGPLCSARALRAEGKEMRSG